MPNSIGVGIIARNVEKTIGQCIESFLEYVDQCVVVLAGESSDKTEEIVRSIKGVEVHKFEWIDDFSAARNFCFSKLNTDWFFWCDADDEVYQAENLRKLADNADADVGAIWLPYHYAVDEFGNPTTVYERERLLRAKFGWVWKSRLHETISPLSQCKFVRSNDVILKHNHLAGQPRGERNFKLLNMMLKEDLSDKRVWLYLGHQNFAGQNWSEAAEWYLKFGSDMGTVPIERYQALCYCSKALRELKDKQAIDVALMAISLFPDYRDGYLEMAHSHLIFGDYDKAIHYAKLSDVGELITQPPSIIFINPLDYTFNKYCLLSEAYMRKGDYDKTLEYLTQAYEVRPVPDIKKHMDDVQILRVRSRVSDGIKFIAMHLINNREILKLEHLLKACPFWFRDLPDYQQLVTGVNHYKSQVKDNPRLAEGDNHNVMVNLAEVLNAPKLLDELDKKYDKVTVVCPVSDDHQADIYSQRDLEELITSQPGRHIINLQKEPTRLICEYDKNIPKDLSVRFFVGQGLEYWSPKTISEIGCGGSETAVAKVAGEMAKRDCQPIIYAMDTQVWDGVIYRHFTNYDPNTIPCHLFISSRVPVVFTDKIPAKQKWLYVHDIHCYDQLSPEVTDEIDVIIALSHWQAEHFKRVYPFLKDCEVIDLDKNPVSYEDNWTATTYYPTGRGRKLPKFAIIGNGLDTDRFKKLSEKRTPHRFIWCSSADRGLEEVLNLWPLLKRELPDAQLKIFYGWNYFDTTLWIPAQQAFKQRILKLIKQDGVEWCGRVGQNQLAKELMKSDAIIYPPHPFRETYGITFLEAQAAGTICFYRKNGALGETIGDRGIPLEMDSTPEQIVSTVVQTLNDNEKCQEIRKAGRKYALSRNWGIQTEKMLTLYKRVEV